MAQIRSRLETLDPTLNLAKYVPAAGRGDTAVLLACNDAHSIAFPRIAQALAANPQAKIQAAVQVRINDDPAVRQVIEAKQTLTEV